MKLLLHLESYAVLLFCGDLIPTNIPALTIEEWQNVTEAIKISHKDGINSLFGLSYEGLTQVVGLSDALARKILKRETLMPTLFYALHNLEKEGIGVTTIYEDNYPAGLHVLKEEPPILYYVGDLSLIDGKMIAIGGRDHQDTSEKQLTTACMQKALIENRTLIIGDRDVDDYMRRYTLSHGGRVVEFVADHMVDIVKKRKRYFNKGTLTIICHRDPYGYYDDEAMKVRDLSLCALASAMFVTASAINSDLYATCVTNLHYHYTPLLVMKPSDMYDGNLRLLEMGGHLVTLSQLASDTMIDDLSTSESIEEGARPDQMSIFEFIEEDDHAA